MKTLLTSLSVAPPVSSPVNEACLITVSVGRTKSSADSNSTWELWALGGSLMVATLPSGLPVLKVKADSWRRSSSSSQWRRGLRLAGRDDADVRLRGRRQGNGNMDFLHKAGRKSAAGTRCARSLVSAKETARSVGAR